MKMAEIVGMDRLPVMVQRCALPGCASPGSSLFSEELAQSQKIYNRLNMPNYLPGQSVRSSKA